MQTVWHEPSASSLESRVLHLEWPALRQYPWIPWCPWCGVQMISTSFTSALYDVWLSRFHLYSSSVHLVLNCPFLSSKEEYHQSSRNYFIATCTYKHVRLQCDTVHPWLSEHSIIWTLDYLNTALVWLCMHSSHLVDWIEVLCVTSQMRHIPEVGHVGRQVK